MGVIEARYTTFRQGVPSGMVAMDALRAARDVRLSSSYGICVRARRRVSTHHLLGSTRN
jgi:hypothetical protein